MNIGWYIPITHLTFATKMNLIQLRTKGNKNDFRTKRT